MVVLGTCIFEQGRAGGRICTCVCVHTDLKCTRSWWAGAPHHQEARSRSVAIQLRMQAAARQAVAELARSSASAVLVLASGSGRSCPQCPACSPTLQCGGCPDCVCQSGERVRAAGHYDGFGWLSVVAVALACFCVGLAAGRRSHDSSGKGHFGGKGVLRDL